MGEGRALGGAGSTHGEGSGLLGCADPVPETVQPATVNAAKAAPANALMVA